MPSPNDSLPVVHYTLECADVDWRVRRMSVHESLGRPYRGIIDVLTEEIDLIADELVGADLVLHAERDESQRTFHGVVLEVEHLGVASGRAFLRLHFGPLLTVLDGNVRSRIFQGRTVPEVVEAVLGPVLSARGRSVDVSAVRDVARPARDYCVQYRETDLAFVHRLLEEEGWVYTFDQHTGEHETMVVLDAAAPFSELAGLDGGMVVPVIGDRPDEAAVESIQLVAWQRRPPSATLTQRDWDWTTDPAMVHEDTVAVDGGDVPPAAQPLPAAERYEHGDHRLLDLDLAARARRKRDAMVGQESIAVGAGNVTGFAPGLVFELDGHELEGRYRILDVIHHGSAPEADLFAGADDGQAEYRNEFRCIPEERPYRPVRTTPRPTIAGPQTAVVTGPKGEEIHTDEHGRIKVRMHWDRDATASEDSSCWIRVAQAWGGPGWGTMFLPRVGMEVVVFFVDGDPDRPLCMGSVYNGQNRPPYALPEERTKSTIKTHSSPGGDGFNELRFEDAAGSEQVFVHAQRDLDEVVRHNHTRSVGADEAVSIGGNRTVTIEGNHSVKVSGKGPDGKPLTAPHCSLDVEDDYQLHASKTVRVQAETSITLQCQNTVIELTPSAILLRAGNGSSMVLDIQALLQSKPGAVMRLDSDGGVVAKSAASSFIRLDTTAQVQSKGGSHVTLTGDATLAAGGDAAAPGASVKLTTDADVQGNKVTLASEAATLEMTTNAVLSAMDLELSGTNATCTAAQGLKLGGATVDVTGVTLATMTAALVKVN